ncbi:vacuolar amino acid transporter 1-like [Tripterygium wilfordii]|uniref:Vacuolar amino acid transporter 1-like n=1 Tax=Tripterygium wilfordii TaxID=458696 RepID=A0A7J7CGQ5_TRIWF|nr:vacuolar amino acid transporter 1-like [Tripterygium wilfordii]
MNTDPLIRTYPDIGEQAFGYVGRTLVSVFMCLELYLVAMEFLILEGDNLFKLFPNTNFTISDVKIGGKQGFVMLTSLIILPTTWLRNLGVLAYVSAGRVLASIIVVACVFWAGTVEVVGFHEGDTLFNLTGIPTAISLFTFCYYGHAMFPTHCNSMNNRSQFSKVLLVCLITSTITYGSMAILGYLMYGEFLKSQVTLNLPIRRISTKIAICTTLINPLTKYAVLITPIATAIEDTFPFHVSRYPNPCPAGIAPASIIIFTSFFVKSASNTNVNFHFPTKIRGFNYQVFEAMSKDGRKYVIYQKKKNHDTTTSDRENFKIRTPEKLSNLYLNAPVQGRIQRWHI